MFGNSVIVLVIFFSGNVFSLPVNKTSSRVCPFEFVNRTEWGARPAAGITSLNTPVPVVVIHHTYLPEACWNKLECGRAMRSMQQTHQQTNGWADIGYNFAVGSDGVVYEGRGWEAVGAHTVGQNIRSIGIVLIGSWIGPSDNEVAQPNGFNIVSRSEWHARDPKQTTNLTVPVPFVVIHHSYRPKACYDFGGCAKAMRSMQNFHMDDRNWWDIGYNFAVGSDGYVYEGRGWTHLGAHALHFNTVSIGIVLIGDWTYEVPPKIQLKTAQALIDQGVSLGYIKKDYKLVGHRQVRDTECPGEAFYQQLKLWPHYVPFPASTADLVNVPELPAETRERLVVKT